MLRPNVFMQTLSSACLDGIRERGEPCVPAGRLRTSFIDARGIGKVVRMNVSARPHHKVRSLTGEPATTLAQFAREYRDVWIAPQTAH